MFGCEDVWHLTYEGAPNDGTVWNDDIKDNIVVRGGAWNSDIDACRISYRVKRLPQQRQNNLGFRVARDP